MQKFKMVSETVIMTGHGYWNTDHKEDISYTTNGHNLILDHENNSFWYRHRNNCIKAVIKKFKTQQLIDVGGGNGYVSKMIQSEGIETILLEPGIDGVLNAKKRGIKNIIKGTMSSVGLKKDSCEAIGIFDVLEHIENDISFIDQIKDALTHNGLLFITVPAHQWLWSSFDLEVGHFRRYNLREMRRLLINAGFTLEYSSYFFSFLWLPQFIIRIIFGNNKKGMKRHSEHIVSKSMIGNLIGSILSFETIFIRKGWRLPLGSSCLVVARKK